MGTFSCYVHFVFVLGTVLLLCGVGVKISEGSRVPCILFYLSLALFSLQLEQKDESLVSLTSLGLLHSKASIKNKLPFFQKKKKKDTTNVCLTLPVQFFSIECPDDSKNPSVYTHVIDGVSMGPLIGATLPKARNILKYASASSNAS